MWFYMKYIVKNRRWRILISMDCTIPKLLCFFFKLLWYPLLTFYLVCISLSWYDIPEIVFVIMIISLNAGLLLARNSHNQGLSVVTLTSSLGMFYGRCND